MSLYDIFELSLIALLILCGLSACLSKNLLVTLIIFMAYSVIMSIVWALLQAPDLAVTEAAVGAGVSGILFYITLKKLRDMRKKDEHEQT